MDIYVHRPLTAAFSRSQCSRDAGGAGGDESAHVRAARRPPRAPCLRHAPMRTQPQRHTPRVARGRVAVFLPPSGKNFNLCAHKLKFLPPPEAPRAVRGAPGAHPSKKPQVRNYVLQDHRFWSVAKVEILAAIPRKERSSGPPSVDITLVTCRLPAHAPLPPLRRCGRLALCAPAAPARPAPPLPPAALRAAALRLGRGRLRGGFSPARWQEFQLMGA